MKALNFIKYALFVFFTQLLLTYTSVSFSAEPVPPKVIGHVIWVTGSLTAQMPNADIRTLKRHSAVYEHDTLKAGPTSEGKVSFTNHSILSLHENSTLKIDQYWHPEQKESSGFIKEIMHSIRDGFRAITGTVTNN